MNQKQKDQVLKKLDAAKTKTQGKFSLQHAALGGDKVVLNTIPSPSMMYDYKSGIGGVPRGHMLEIFGSNGLGKTSMFGYGVLASCQRQSLLPVLIAVEPTFDAKWAQKVHGLDPDLLLIMRPDNAEEAFEMLYEIVFEMADLVDYVLIDSIGAMGNRSSQEGGKKKAFGVSGTVTAGLNDIMPKLYKNEQGLMIINQQRESTDSGPTMRTIYESPGGQALKHHAMVRLQLKPGSSSDAQKARMTAVVDGEKLKIGRTLKMAFIKNKLAEAVNKSAEVDFYHIETPGRPFGVDRTSDIVNTAKIAGVVRAAGAWLYHESFPGGQVNGTVKFEKLLRESPEVEEAIRKDVLSRMLQNEVEAAKENAKKAAHEAEKAESEPEVEAETSEVTDGTPRDE